MYSIFIMIVALKKSDKKGKEQNFILQYTQSYTEHKDNECLLRYPFVRSVFKSRTSFTMMTGWIYSLPLFWTAQFEKDGKGGGGKQLSDSKTLQKLHQFEKPEITELVSKKIF